MVTACLSLETQTAQPSLLDAETNVFFCGQPQTCSCLLVRAHCKSFHACVVCSLVIVGDLGQTHNSSATLDHMMESLTDVAGHNAAPHLLYTADYSYSDDYQSNGTETVRAALKCVAFCVLQHSNPQCILLIPVFA